MLRKRALTAVLALIIAGTQPLISQNNVSSGTSVDLDAYRQLYDSLAADGVNIGDIVGLGIAGSDDHVYVWYKDGTVSSGSTKDLDTYRERRSYSLPPGYWPEDIVGIGIAGSNDHVYVWYRDWKVSSGTSTDLDAYKVPYEYTLPPGKGPMSIVGMGIAGSNDHVHVWYDNGEVSSGNSSDLDKYHALQAYSPPSVYSADQIIGMGIAGSDDHVYTWYGACVPGERQLLNLRNTPQETGQWCWAASAWMVMDYVANIHIPQCTQANALFGFADCCNALTPNHCIEPGWPEFSRWGFDSKEKPGALSWNELRSEIAHGGSCRGQPFPFSWRWYVQQPDGSWILDGGHMMVAMGYHTVDGKGFAQVQDPWPPTQGEYRVDSYEFFVRQDFHHEHNWDIYDVTFTGGI